MVTTQKQAAVKCAAENVYAQGADWVTFYREVLGLDGIVRRVFPTRDDLAEFEQTEVYQQILQMLTKLRGQGPLEESDEPTRIITVRLPKSLHEALREEAHEHRTSINKLCISKLLQFIDGERVPAEYDRSVKTARRAPSVAEMEEEVA
jgi:predicted HicB family RNase H-like nuclease